MDSNQFREFGRAAIDYVADYMDTIRERQVIPSVQPGYLRQMIPDSVPEEPDSWQDFMADMDRVIMPGMTHWASPQFHAYFPAGNSFPAIVGEILGAGMGCIGFSWSSNPACTELEVEMMNWLGKLLGLPEEFLNSSGGPGGGIIQSSASEATLVCLLAAVDKKINIKMMEDPNSEKALIRNKLVAYTSNQSNLSVEKAAKLAAIRIRLLPADSACRLTGKTLRTAIKEDIAVGLIPCYLIANLGTTGTCAFDSLDELGPICEEYGVWMHVDAAYAGAAFSCPEFRYLMYGIEYAQSFDFNPHKWMLVNFDCSAMWVKDTKSLISAMKVSRVYMEVAQMDSMPDYRHWQIPLGRRFRSIKLWAVLRLYGASGIRNSIRKHVKLAKQFETLMRADGRFELVNEVVMGLVCFRVKKDDVGMEKMMKRLKERKRIFMMPCNYDGRPIMRFCVCSRMCESSDVEYAWNEITTQADDILMTKAIAVGKESSEEFEAMTKINFSTELRKSWF